MTRPNPQAQPQPAEPLVGQADGTSTSSAALAGQHGLPDPREVNTCRSCGAVIWWRINPSGKRQPFDYDVKNRNGTDMPHHATCPQGRDWSMRTRIR